MEEGFYWVRYAGAKVVAWYANEETRDYLTGEIITGVWHFVGAGDVIAYGNEVSVLSGPLQPPEENEVK